MGQKNVQETGARISQDTIAAGNRIVKIDSSWKAFEKQFNNFLKKKVPKEGRMFWAEESNMFE